MIGMESSVGLAFFLRNLGALCISVMEFRSTNDSPQNCRVRRGGAESLSDGHFREVTRCVDNPVGVRNTRPRLLT